MPARRRTTAARTTSRAKRSTRVTPAAFRAMALAMPLATEGSHMGHADFRVGGKIFATLPGARRLPGVAGATEPEELAMVKLTPGGQREFVAAAPDAFIPVPGAWGARGCTYVRLARVRRAALKRAVAAAWESTAPKGVLDEFARGAGGA